MNALETLKTLKATIAAAFSAEPAPVEPAPAPVEPAPIEMKEYALLDGTKVMIDKLETGGKVAIVDPSGVEIASADAEYQLADGSTIKVESGLITEISAPAVVEPIEPDMAMEEMKAKNEKLEAELAQLKKSTNEGFTTILNFIETLVQTPAVDPIVTPKTFVQQTVESKSEKFAAAAAALEEFKNHKNK